MRTFAVAAALILFGAPKPEQDTVWLKDGRPIRGVIVSETDEEVYVQILGTGRKGATAATTGVRYRKDEIQRIDRMSDEARRKAIAKFKAFRSRHARRTEALEKIEPERVRFMGRNGLRAVGTHFEVLSTCDDRFVREVTWNLDEVFNAYQQSFGVRRNADRRIRVYLLSDVDDYRRFQQAKLGGVIENPAFYSVKGNYIAAYNMVRKDAAARIRKKILELERGINDYKKQISEGESKIRKQAADLRKKIRAEAAKAKRKIQRDNYTQKAERKRRVEKWKKDQLKVVGDRERAAKKKLAAFKQTADEAIGKNRGIIANNNRVLRDQNRRMFEMLFHEGFHAFTRNFLWKNTSVPRWLDEGLASYYEMSAVDAGELIHGAPHPQFLARLRKALREGAPLGIEQMLRGGGAQFLVAHRSEKDRANLYYAQSWAIAHYMAGRVPRERIEAYVTAVAAGVDHVRAFETMMGQPIRHVAVDVQAHVRRLP